MTIARNDRLSVGHVCVSSLPPKSLPITGLIGRNINAPRTFTGTSGKSRLRHRRASRLAAFEAHQWSLDRVRGVPLQSPPLRLASVRRRHPLSHGVSRSHGPFALLAG